ncbi:hypothetical protein RKE29_14935, partial [Streptomyces sp. B1866]|nr:hypothetical protein [Streptomyces sp. B1866]
ASRPLPGGGAGTALAAPVPEPLALLAAGGWLRLRTPYGSVALRRGQGGLSALSGLTVTPTRPHG